MKTLARRRRWVAAVVAATAVAAATLAAYIPAMRGGWVWDDNHHVTDNVDLRTVHGLRELWLRPGAVPQYYPVTHTTFWIEWHLWGVHPGGYHLDNVLLHIANAMLIGLILRRLRAPGWGLAAAMFALHPVHVESVAWVTERKNVLSGFFYLSAMWMALDVWHIVPSTKQRLKLRYVGCLGLFLLALLSKSVTATWPVIVLLLIVWKRRRIVWQDAVSLAPFFAAAAAMGSVTVWMEKHVVGAVGGEWTWGWGARTVIAGRAVWFYLGKLAWPHPLLFVYHKWTIDPGSAGQWVYPAGVVGALAMLWLARRRVGSGPLVALLFFLISLVPALGFFDVYPMRYSFVADHFQYLASIGPIAVAAAVLSRWRVGSVVILVVLGVLTWRQAGAYAGAETLWRDVVGKDAESVIGHCDLGIALHDRGEDARAAVELHEALALDPHFIEAWMGLGSVAEGRGELNEAEEDYQAGRAAAPQSPLPMWRMGLLDRRRGKMEEARSEFEQAAVKLPNPAPAYEQLGEIDLSAGRLGQAAEEFGRAMGADPDLIDAHNNLAATALAQQDGDLARRQCEAALAIDPENATACNNMGIVLVMEGKPDEAAGFFSKALKLDPTLGTARQNLEKLGR